MGAIAYGIAKDLEFGTLDIDLFTIVEEISEENSFGNEILTHDNAGNINGMIKSEARGSITVRGMATLASITALDLGDIMAAAGGFPELVSGDAYIESISSTRSNTDLQRFEITATAIDGISGEGEAIGT